MNTIKKIIFLLAAFLMTGEEAQAQCNAGNSPTFQVTTSQVTLATNGFCGMHITIMNAATNPFPGGPLSYSIVAPGQSSIIIQPIPTPTVATVAGVWTVMVIDHINLCVTSQTVQITVLQAPVVSIAVSNSLVCLGGKVTLTGNGANSYTWSTGAAAASVSVSPLTSSIYSVTGTGTNVCANTAVVAVSVNPLPTVTVSADQNSVCANELVTLTASGASTYTWSTLQTGAGITVTPAVTMVYTVNGTDAHGCRSNGQVLVSVSPCTGSMELKSEPEALKLFPLPAQDFIELEISGTEFRTGLNSVAIYNELGQLIKDVVAPFKEQRLVIRTDDLSNGVYSLQIRNSRNESITKKILIAK